jgi:hypothetical protein
MDDMRGKEIRGTGCVRPVLNPARLLRRMPMTEVSESLVTGIIDGLASAREVSSVRWCRTRVPAVSLEQEKCSTSRQSAILPASPLRQV